jgi:hypothetical protein
MRLEQYVLLASSMYFYHESCTLYVLSTYLFEQYILVLGTYLVEKVRTVTGMYFA